MSTIMTHFRRAVIINALVVSLFIQAMAPALAGLPSRDKDRDCPVHAVGVEAKYAGVVESSDVSAGMLHYTRHDGQIQLIVGKRDDSRGWCSFGGKADQGVDPSIADAASRESREESNGILCEHPRDLVEAAFHDLWTLTGDQSSLFRLYVHEMPYLDPRAFMERQKGACDAHSQEYTDYAYISLTQWVANGALPEGMELMPEFDRLLRLIGADVLEAAEGNRFNEWRNDATILRSSDKGLVDITAEHAMPDYGERAPKFSPFALELTKVLLERVDKMPNPGNFMGGDVSDPEAATAAAPPLVEEGASQRALSPTENHIRMVLGAAFKDARDATTPADSAAIHRDNLTAFLQKAPFRSEEMSPEKKASVKNEEAVEFLVPILLREIDLFGQNILSNYHAAKGAIVFLWSVWGQIRAVLTQNDKEPLKFRGHDLYVHGQPSNIGELKLPQGDYTGVNAAIILCINAVLMACPTTSLSTSSSAEYACTDHSVQDQNLTLLHQEAMELLGVVSDFGPYYSLYHQVLAFLGGPEGCNGAMCQITIPQARADKAMQWGYYGTFSSPTTWSTLLPALACDLAASTVVDGRIPIVTEGRLLVHPELPVEVTTTYYHHPSKAEIEKLVRDINRLVALDAVGTYLNDPKMVAGAMINAPKRWALFDNLEHKDIPPYKIKIADTISETTLELFVNCGAYDCLTHLTYNPSDAIKILVSSLAKNKPEFIKVIHQFFFKEQSLRDIFSPEDFAQFYEALSLGKSLIGFSGRDQELVAYLCDQFQGQTHDGRAINIAHILCRTTSDDPVLERVTEDYLRAHKKLPDWGGINNVNAYLDQGGKDKKFLKSIMDRLIISSDDPQTPHNALYLRLLALPYFDANNHVSSNTRMEQCIQEVLNQRLQNGTFTSGYMTGAIQQMMGYGTNHSILVGPLNKLDPQDLRPYQQGRLDITMFGGSVKTLLEWMQRQPQDFDRQIKKVLGCDEGSWTFDAHLIKAITSLFFDETQTILSAQVLHGISFSAADCEGIIHRPEISAVPLARLVGMVLALQEFGVTDFSSAVREKLYTLLKEVEQGHQPVDVDPRQLLKAFKATLEHKVGDLSFIDPNLCFFKDNKSVARYWAQHGSMDQVVQLTEACVIRGYHDFLKEVINTFAESADKSTEWLAAAQSNGLIWSVLRRLQYHLLDPIPPLAAEDFPDTPHGRCLRESILQVQGDLKYLNPQYYFTPNIVNAYLDNGGSDQIYLAWVQRALGQFWGVLSDENFTLLTRLIQKGIPLAYKINLSPPQAEELGSLVDDLVGTKKFPGGYVSNKGKIGSFVAKDGSRSEWTYLPPLSEQPMINLEALAAVDPAGVSIDTIDRLFEQLSTLPLSTATVNRHKCAWLQTIETAAIASMGSPLQRVLDADADALFDDVFPKGIIGSEERTLAEELDKMFSPSFLATDGIKILRILGPLKGYGPMFRLYEKLVSWYLDVNPEQVIPILLSADNCSMAYTARDSLTGPILQGGMPLAHMIPTLNWYALHDPSDYMFQQCINRLCKEFPQEALNFVLESEKTSRAVRALEMSPMVAKLLLFVPEVDSALQRSIWKGYQFWLTHITAATFDNLELGLSKYYSDLKSKGMPLRPLADLGL